MLLHLPLTCHIMVCPARIWAAYWNPAHYSEVIQQLWPVLFLQLRELSALLSFLVIPSRNIENALKETGHPKTDSWNKTDPYSNVHTKSLGFSLWLQFAFASCSTESQCRLKIWHFQENIGYRCQRLFCCQWFGIVSWHVWKKGFPLCLLHLP